MDVKKRNPKTKKKQVKEDDSNYDDPDFVDMPCKVFDVNDTTKHQLIFEE